MPAWWWSPKRQGSVCVDLKPLNANVLREVHPLPAVDETLAQLTIAAIFSKLDANSGFWQIPLLAASRPLTAFIMPFGRYSFNKLPFGITSTSDHFQKRMSAILEGLEGVLCVMDDVLVFGKTKAEHDKRLFAVLQQIQKTGITLNTDKCEFWHDKLTFLGHVVNKEGISPDPAKIAAIKEMGPPTNTTEVRRFLGMVNKLGKFSKRTAELSSPLCELLSSKNAWTWGDKQEEAFANIKIELIQPTILALYNPTAETKISADASSHSLGAVLLQLNEFLWQPVAYASRALTDTERRYAQIEKEALTVTWGCEGFSSYIIGKHVQIETDHKPLVPLLSCKPLENLLPRIVRFRLRMMRFDYSIRHVPGKLLYTAARFPNPEPPSTSQIVSQAEVESYIDVANCCTTSSKQVVIVYYNTMMLMNQYSDPTCSKVINYCKTKWLERHAMKDELKPYWQLRAQLSFHDDLLLFRDCIVVPYHVPWERIGADLFELDKAAYLIVIDYFSRYPEVVKLTSTTSKSVIAALKSMFSRHGIPAFLVSDNGPQFISGEMQEFAKQYSFTHTTSSPHYHQSNGMAERTVRTVKQLLRNTPDPYLGLLSYRATPLPWCGKSPSKLLMSRRVCTDVPQTDEHFVSSLVISEGKTKSIKGKKKTMMNTTGQDS